MRYEHYDSLETRDPDDREREFSASCPISSRLLCVRRDGQPNLPASIPML